MNLKSLYQSELGDVELGGEEEGTCVTQDLANFMYDIFD